MSLAPIRTERDRDIQRKREKRSEAARIDIPPIGNPERRRACLADPALFLKTYMGDRFYNPWATHHLEMIAAIVQTAKDGGDQAIAAPRGDGKTEICAATIVYCMLAGLIRFPVVVAATGALAYQIFKDIKGQFEHNELLAGDFPEVAYPVANLQGAPQRAAKQHVKGKLTRIEWTKDHVIFPKVPGSIYGGMCLTYRGLDAAIRGAKFRGQRPDFVLIDDPETRESAKPDSQQIKDRTLAIDRDIAGLAGPNRILSRVILTTIQNRHCLSATFTDRTQRPSYNGKRFGAVKVWPERRELWEEYIALRQDEQGVGDKETPKATQFYLDNRAAMDAGAVVSNPYRFAPGEVSALQSFFNRIADWGISSVMAELQNDPEDDTEIETIGLTAGKVQSRLSGYEQNTLPQAECRITVGMDIGKFLSYWVKVAWLGNATGMVVDYGVMQTPGLGAQSDSKAVEVALLPALMQWRTEILSGVGDHSPIVPELCFIDANAFTHSVYEFIRQVGGVPFAASKGWDTGRFSLGKAGPERKLFHEAYALHQPHEKLWLYHVHTEYWKQWVHERFNTQTYDESNQVNDGSLSLFVHPDKNHHKAFAHHIVAEERREIFVPGKGVQVKWLEKSRLNHWLDATALACAAAGVLGVRLIQRVTETELNRASSGSQKPQPKLPKPLNRINRPGGWLKGMK